MTVDVHISTAFLISSKCFGTDLVNNEKTRPVFRLDTLQHLVKASSQNTAGLGGQQLERRTNVPWHSVVRCKRDAFAENPL